MFFFALLVYYGTPTIPVRYVAVFLRLLSYLHQYAPCDRRGTQDQRTARHHAARGGRGGSVGHDRRRAEGGGRGASTSRSPLPLYEFVMRDREPRHQHDMREFVMAARIHAKTGRLSEVLGKG